MKKLLTILSLILLTSCGVNWHVSTLNYDPIYDDENYIVVSDDVNVDTISSRWDFERKLRTDFNFRWDYANYMINQPLSFYYRNYPGLSIGNAHYLWWNSNQYWTDWAFNYPFTSFNSWYWNRWNRPWMGNAHWGYGWYGNTWNNHWWRYGYSGWYGHDSWRWGSTVWGSNTWRNDATYVHINGRRGSSNISVNRGNSNSNIDANVNRRNNSNNNSRIRVYRNPNSNNNVIVRDGENIRIYRRPNDNDNNIRSNNNTRNNNWKPRVPNNVNNRPPVINNPRPIRVEQNTRTNYNTNRSTNVRSSNSRSNGSTQIKRNN